MQFMIIRKADQDTEAGVLPSEQLLNDMTAYNERLVRAGVLRDGNGLQPSANGARVTFSGGKPSVTDGPFTEAKELIAGYSVIEVGSRAEAIEWARQWPASDGNGQVELEIRPIVTEDDFGEAFTPELREREAGQRERVRQQNQA